MTTLHTVKLFVAMVQKKITERGYFMLKRDKNTETLVELNFDSSDVERTLLEIKAQDYSQGPLPDEIGGGQDMWVFGKTIQGKEIYIKITQGRDKQRALVISFHKAERKMTYPFRL
jgi:hypothetical protein